MKKICIIGLLTVSVISAVNADIIPSLNPVPPAATSGGFLWNYSANVTVDQIVNPGDFFTIYDFGNFHANSALQPTGWTFSSSLLGTTPSLVTPSDDPSLMNLTWTYNGQTPISGSALLGNFSVVADTDQLRISHFAAQGTRNGGPNDGTKVDNVGQITVPIPEMSALLPILSVCGAGLIASVPSLLRRRKQ